MHIEIIGKTAAPEPNLPSHLFPGCGSDRGRFRVVGVTTTREEVEDVFAEWTPRAIQVTRFDPATGEGVFVVIDDDAPDVGTIIPWPTDEAAAVHIPAKTCGNCGWWSRFEGKWLNDGGSCDRPKNFAPDEGSWMRPHDSCDNWTPASTAAHAQLS